MVRGEEAHPARTSRGKRPSVALIRLRFRANTRSQRVPAVRLPLRIDARRGRVFPVGLRLRVRQTRRRKPGGRLSVQQVGVQRRSNPGGVHLEGRLPGGISKVERGPNPGVRKDRGLVGDVRITEREVATGSPRGDRGEGERDECDRLLTAEPHDLRQIVTPVDMASVYQRVCGERPVPEAPGRGSHRTRSPGRRAPHSSPIRALHCVIPTAVDAAHRPRSHGPGRRATRVREIGMGSGLIGL